MTAMKVAILLYAAVSDDGRRCAWSCPGRWPLHPCASYPWPPKQSLCMQARPDNWAVLHNDEKTQEPLRCAECLAAEKAMAEATGRGRDT